MNHTQSHSEAASLARPFAGLTLPQVLCEQAARLKEEHVAIREKSYGIWHALNWSQYLQHTRWTALGLWSLGLRRGDNLALIVDNEPEWLFSELGAQSLGAVPLNLFTSAAAGEIVRAVRRIRARIVVAQNQEQVDKLLENKDQLSDVQQVVYIDPTGMRLYRQNPWLTSFAELLEAGSTLDRQQAQRFETELRQGRSADTALMIMTSGTTGQPKLVMLSHDNFADMAAKWLATSPIAVGDNWISISPPAWIVDQMWGVGVALFGGMTMNFPETQETVTQDFREIGPQIIITSSRFWEDLASRIRVKIADSGPVKRWFYHTAQRIGRAAIAAEEKDRRLSLAMKLLKKGAYWTVSRPLLDRIGCLNFKTALTGGHPISPDVIRFFRINGLNLKQCYGMTEACGIFQVQPDGQVKPETVGVSLPGTRVKINPDQEVLVAGGSIFRGYYEDPQALAEALEEGWLRTGDAGYFDDDGHLVILGRKQDIMRTRDGDPFSPDFIETRLKFNPYIKEAVIWGEGRPYLSAFINIDFENVGQWAEERKIPYTTYLDLSRQPVVEELICRQVRQTNQALPEAMHLSRILLLYKLLDADDEELTRTGKVRRKFVAQRYQELIEALYDDRSEVAVKGQVNYRDGTIGTIESTLRILSL